MGKDLSLYTNYLETMINPILNKYKDKMKLDYLSSQVTESNGEVIIEVNIDDKFQITLEQISEFTKLVNEEIDLLDVDIGPYILDISSSSSSRTIKISELDYFINKYISVETTSEKYEDIELISKDEKNIYCTFFKKGQLKKLTIDLKSIKKINISYKA